MPPRPRARPGPAVHRRAAPPAVLAVERLPAILALPLKSWLEEASPVLRLWHAVDVVELSLRFAVFVAVAELVEHGRSPGTLIRELRAGIERPTLGQWRNLARALTRAVATLPHPLVPELGPWVDARLVPLLDGPGPDANSETSLLRLRHRLAHGGSLTPALARRLLVVWSRPVTALFADLPWLEEIQVLARREGGGWGALRGPSVDLQSLHMSPELGASLARVPQRRDLVLLARGASLRTLWPLALYGVPLTAQILGASTRAVPQVYSRRGEFDVEYTPLGSDDVSESVADPEALAAFLRTVGLDGTDEERAFAVRGFERELQREVGEFVGREAEVEEIVSRLTDAVDGVYWLEGTAGMGKSSLVAQTFASACERLAAGGGPTGRRVFPYRFRVGDDRCDRGAFLRFVVERLESCLGGPAPRASPPSPVARIEQLLRLLPGLSVVLLLDGLDEVAERDPAFVEEVIGPLRLPGLVWLCAGRPERGLPESFARLAARRALRDGLQPLSERDVRALLLERLGPARKGFLASEHSRKGAFNVFGRSVYQASGGLPIYLRYVLGDLRAGRLRPDVDPLPRLPTSLDAYHDETIHRAEVGATPAVRTAILGLLAVVREPVTAEWLRALLDGATDLLEHEPHPEGLVRRALTGLGPVLRHGVDREGGTTLRLYHHSFRERLGQHPETAGAVKRALGWIARLAEAPDRGPAVLAAYLLRWGARHLLTRGQDNDRRALADLLLRPGYLARRWAEAEAREEVFDDLVDAHPWLDGLPERSPAPDLLLDRYAADALRNPSEEPERLHALMAYRRDLGLYDAFLERACRDENWTSRGVDPAVATNLALAFQGRRANLLRRQARTAEAMVLLEDCVRRYGDAAPTERGRRELARVEYDLGYVAFLGGDRARAVAWFGASARHSAEGSDGVGAWISRCVAARVEFELGDRDGRAFAAVLAAARADFEPVARHTGDPTAVRWMRNVAMHGIEAALAVGEGDRAWGLIREYEGDTWNVRYGDPDRLGHLKARAHLLDGDAREAAAILRRALYRDDGAERRDVTGEGLAGWFVHYGDALDALGQGDAARASWRRALALPVASGNRPAQDLARSRLAS